MDPVKDEKRGSTRVITFDMPSCGGCRTCELACSFYHTKAFAPENASLKIRDKQTGEQGFHVQLVAQSNGAPPACNACMDLDIPLCIEHCKESDDLYQILEAFKKNIRP